MKKGDFVEIKKDCEGAYTNYRMSGIYYAQTPMTPHEIDEWYDKRDKSNASKLDDAGKPILAPVSKVVMLQKGTCYIVEQARCKVNLSHGKPSGGMAKISCLKTGKTAYIKREHLTVLQ